MIEIAGRRASFQPGDQVLTLITSDEVGRRTGRRYKADELVSGVIICWVNWDARMLDQGRVQIKTADGDVLWVTAVEVEKTEAERTHPLLSTYAAAVKWTCVCGESGYADTEAEAKIAHTKHGEKGQR